MRVKSNAESKKLADAGRGSLVPIFKWEVGHTYNLVFLTDSQGDQILYQERIHKLGFSRNGKTAFDTVRCVKDYIDETPDPLDPKRARNTGECPYCVAAREAGKIAKAEKEAWEAENPDATKEEKEAAMKKINSKKLVSSFDTERYYLCAEILSSDKAGKSLEMEDGIPKFRLVLLKITSSQYDKKLLIRIADMFDATGSETLDYCQIKFSYPDADGKDDKAKKMASAKDLDMSFPMGSPKLILEKNPGLEEKIREAVAKLEVAPEVDGKPGNPDDAPINKLDEKLYSFVAESETKIEQTLAAKCSQYSADMSDEDKEKLAGSIEASQMETEMVGTEDLASKFNMGEEDTTDSSSNESVFDTEA